MKKGFLIISSIFFIINTIKGQSDIGIETGMNLWFIGLDVNTIAQPSSNCYTIGTYYEKIFNESGMGLQTGFLFNYAPKGNSYIDLSDGQNISSVIFSKEINERYIMTGHRMIELPVLFVYYNSIIRTAAGFSFSYYFFDPTSNTGFKTPDISTNISSGLRISEHFAFEIGYKFGLLSHYSLSGILPGNNEKSNFFESNMHQVSIRLKFSIWNNYPSIK